MRRGARLCATSLGGPLRSLFLSGDVVRLSKARRRLAAAHDGVDVVRALADTLPLRISLDRARRAAMWQAIEAALWPEVTILDALLRAAQSPQSLALWLAPLRTAFAEARRPRPPGMFRPVGPERVFVPAAPG